jgi:hypothetical protein
MKTYRPIDIPVLRTCTLKSRASKVDRGDFGKPWLPGGTFADFLASLPNILGADDLRGLAGAIVASHRAERPVMMAMGAHVIKVGLNPIVADLIERGILSAVALNGAGIIHDVEVAMIGRTSEDVQKGLEGGAFGMTKDSADFLNQSIAQAAATGEGLGAAVGRHIVETDLPYVGDSILGVAYRRGIPATVHVAMGTDVLHVHPEFDPTVVGAASHRDFRLFASVVSDLEGGVYLNVGSAVILPEVFLKALTLVRNMGAEVKSFTTANLDFIRHYRPMANVVTRPTSLGGTGYSLVGHHEIMFPLLAASIIEALGS